MSEKLLQSSRQMTRSWQEVVSIPNCFKIYQALGAKEFDELRRLSGEQLAKKDVSTRAIVSYLRALDSFLKV